MYRKNYASCKGLYKVWCPKAEVQLYLGQLGFGGQAQNIMFFMEHDINNMYCIYVGKSLNLNKRIDNHKNGPSRKSTLRRSVFAADTGMYKSCAPLKIAQEGIITQEISKFVFKKLNGQYHKEIEVINEFLRLFNIADLQDKYLNGRFPNLNAANLRRQIVDELKRRRNS